MVYADTDFFLALMKESDWLKSNAHKLYKQHKGNIWTSPATLIELLWLARKYCLDATRLILDALEIAELKDCDPKVFLTAAAFMRNEDVEALDALHAANCGKDYQIISSDKIYDTLGIKRIPLS